VPDSDPGNRGRPGRNVNGERIWLERSLEGNLTLGCIKQGFHVGIMAKANKVGIIEGVCDRPSNQEAFGILYKQLREVSQVLALVLMGDFIFISVSASLIKTGLDKMSK